MRTRISCWQNRCYELVIDDGAKGDKRKVLAAMTLFEGTGCWMLTDIRLHRSRTPSAYSGGLFSDDIHCYFKPKDPDESQFVDGLLRDYTVDKDGGIHWSSFEGLVRGKAVDRPPISDNGVGYFSKKEGLEQLNRIQEFWDVYEGSPVAAKVDNPNRQPSEMEVSTRIIIRQQKSGVLVAEGSESIVAPSALPNRSPSLGM